MDIYSHLFPDGNREWVAQLDCLASWLAKRDNPQPKGIDLVDEIRKQKYFVAVTRIEGVTRGL